MIINMMSGRYHWLEFLLEGYAKTGQPLIGFDGTQLVPFNGADDIGMYYLVPALVRTFTISLDTAIYFFFYGIMVVAAVLGLLGFWLLYRSWQQRLVACVGIAGVLYIARLPDVYMMYPTCVVALIPLFLYFMQQNELRKSFVLFMLGAGFWLGCAHAIRAFAGLPVAVFMLSVLVLSKLEWRVICIVVGALTIGMCIPLLYFKSVYAAYLAWAAANVPGHLTNLDRHVIWHTIYVGFGYLSNAFGIKWDDSVAAAKVKEVAPNVAYISSEYETVLRTLVVNFIKEHKGFVIETMFAKLGVCFYYFLKAANVGAVAAWFYPKSWRIEVPFFVALLSSCAFALIAIPYHAYMLGFMALAIVYGVVSINYFLTMHAYKAPTGTLVK